MSGANKRVYRAKAKSWGLGETKSGAEQVAVEFSILTEGAAETSLTWHGYFSEKTFDRTIQSLRYCGWSGDDMTNLEGLDANEVDIVVEDEEYEGKTFAKVQWVNKPGGLQLKAPMAEEKAKAFAASMRDKIRALDAATGTKPNGAKATAKPAAAKAAAATDDLPF